MTARATNLVLESTNPPSYHRNMKRQARMADFDQWRSVLILSLCIGLPTYAIAGFTVYSLAAHFLAVAFYLGALFFSEGSYTVSQVFPALLMAVVLAAVGVIYHFTNIPHPAETERTIMRWAIRIFAAGCVWAFLRWCLILGATAAHEETVRNSVLRTIANEYFTRRQDGETLDQIADALYKQYPISKPVEFASGYYNPLPSAKVDCASLMKQVPDEAKQLSEIAYKILCNQGVYPMPEKGEALRNSVAEFAAMTGMLRECVAQMAALEAAGRKLHPDIREMVTQWAEVGTKVASKVFNHSQGDPEP